MSKHDKIWQGRDAIPKMGRSVFFCAFFVQKMSKKIFSCIFTLCISNSLCSIRQGILGGKIKDENNNCSRK